MLRNCSKDTNFLHANDQLTSMVNRLLAIARAEEAAWEDLRAYHAPSECWNDVQKSYDARRKELFWSEGMDETEFYAAFAARTTDRWVYYNFPVR